MKYQMAAGAVAMKFTIKSADFAVKLEKRPKVTTPIIRRHQLMCPTLDQLYVLIWYI